MKVHEQILKLSRTVDPILSKFERFKFYMTFKYYVWDHYINNQNRILSRSVMSLSESITDHIFVPKFLNPFDRLGEYFLLFRSDKSSRHNYHQFYGELISGIDGKVLEIGLGSTSTERYAAGQPGGGLRAMRMFNPNLELFGGDIDRESVKAVEFVAYELDQTKEESIRNFATQMAQHGPFDLIIDDGYHEFFANIKTFEILRNLISSGGNYVVEDVHESHIHLWNVYINVHKLNGKILDMRSYRPKVKDNILIHIQF